MQKTFKIQVENLEGTEKLAAKTAEILCEHGGLICLFGNIGAGKTAFVKFIAKYLGIKEKVSSPSFVILNEYHSGKIPFYHFDLYRLEQEGLNSVMDELKGYSEKEKILTVIEWAEFSSGSLPDERIEIEIRYVDQNKRDFIFSGYGEKNSSLLEKFIEKE